MWEDYLQNIQKHITQDLGQTKASIISSFCSFCFQTAMLIVKGKAFGSKKIKYISLPFESVNEKVRPFKWNLYRCSLWN